MNPIYGRSGIDSVGIVVSQQETVSSDVAPAFRILESLLYDAETVRMFQGQLELSFSGYDTDPRELYQIPEVRQCVATLDVKFPYWFYFLSTHTDTLKMIAFCLCRTREISAGLAYPDPDDMKIFFLSHLNALNHLFDRFGLDESINEEISDLVANYFFPSSTV